MKVTVLQENLAKAVGIAQRFAATRGQLPILSNILLATEKGRLKIAATNLEIGVKQWIGAKVEEEGEITVPAKVAAEFIMSLPKEKVNLGVEGEKLKISCGSYQAELRGIGAGEFPETKEIAGKEIGAWKLGEFEQMISQVALAAATDEGRPILTGLRWRIGKEGVELAATDGYRLSVKTVGKIRNDPTSLKLRGAGEEKILIIPARALMEVAQIGKGWAETKEGGVKMGEVEKGGQVVFDLGDAQVTTRLLAGDFPEFAKIIPQESETVAEMEVEELAAAVRTAAIFARDSANVLRWEVGEGGIVIAANSPQVGENRIEVEAKVTGKGGKIAFNSRYVIDMLGAIGSARIKFEMTEAVKPGVFRPVEGGDLLYLVMPVRLQE